MTARTAFPRSAWMLALAAFPFPAMGQDPVPSLTGPPSASLVPTPSVVAPSPQPGYLAGPAGASIGRSVQDSKPRFEASYSDRILFAVPRPVPDAYIPFRGDPRRYFPTSYFQESAKAGASRETAPAAGPRVDAPVSRAAVQNPALSLTPLAEHPVNDRPAPASIPAPAPPATVVPSLGASSTAPVTLDVALQAYCRNNLDLKFNGLALDQSRADIVTAGTRPNPTMYVDAQSIPYGGFRNTNGGPLQGDLQFNYPIDVAGKRRALVTTAQLIQAVNERGASDKLRSGIDGLYTAFVDATAAQLLSGPGAKNLKIELASLLGIPAEKAQDLHLYDRFLDPHVAAEQQVATQPDDELIGMALRARPDLLAVETDVKRADAGLRQEKLQRYPDVQTLIQPELYKRGAPSSYPLSPGAFKRDSNAFTLGFTVPVPVFDRRQGPIAKAEAEVQKARIVAEKSKKAVVADVLKANNSLVEAIAAFRGADAKLHAAGRADAAARSRADQAIAAAKQERDASEAAYRDAAPADKAIALARLDEASRRVTAEIARQQAATDLSGSFLAKASEEWNQAAITRRKAMLRVNTAVGVPIYN